MQPFPIHGWVSEVWGLGCEETLVGWREIWDLGYGEMLVAWREIWGLTCGETLVELRGGCLQAAGKKSQEDSGPRAALTVWLR